MSGISFNLAITVQISEVSSENSFSKDNLGKFQAKIVLVKITWEKIGLAMNSSEGSREGAECVLRPNQRTKLSLPVTHELMNSK